MRLVRTEYWNPNTGTIRTGSTGRGESLADMETYLLPLTAALLDGAFGSGVAQGLSVTAATGQPAVTVSPGLAVDGTGRPVVLSDGGAVVIDPNVPADQVQNVTLVLVGSGGVDLPTTGLTGAQVLTVTAREALDGTAGAAAWSLVHAPWLRLVPAATFVDDGSSVPLALVTLDAGSAVSALEVGLRRAVAPALGGLTLTSDAATGGGNLAVGADPGPTLRSRADGGLDVLVPGGALSVAGPTGHVGIGLGAEPASTPLQVVGSVHASGPAAELSFMDRSVSDGYVPGPAGGERWVWYADSGSARLWSGTDQLTVGEPGEGGGLDVPRRMRVRQGSDASAGIWFWQNTTGDAAFVGLSDDDHVGLWGPGAGFGLTMDVHDGSLATRAGLTIGDGGRGSLSVTGDLTVGAGNNGAVTTRHINGKLVGSDGPDDLWLNWNNGKSVHVGGGAVAAFGVHGSAVVDGNLRAAGGLTLPDGGTVQSEGRLHITGAGLLYLLNRDGVVVGREWGGNGTLMVEDNLTVWGRRHVPLDQNTIPGWSGGGILTWDVFALGGVYVGNINTAAAFLKSDGTKHFLIEHPLDVDRSLDHVCLEGPEAAVYYRGSGQLVDGRAEVELPAYFEPLTRAELRTVLLTPVADDGEPVSVLAASPVRAGRFAVRAADRANPEQRFHWQVTAVRADVEPVEAEPFKRGTHNGTRSMR